MPDPSQARLSPLFVCASAVLGESAGFPGSLREQPFTGESEHRSSTHRRAFESERADGCPAPHRDQKHE
jgi:hypothetical protein